MSLSLFVIIRSTSEASGAEETVARVSARAVAFDGPGADVLTPCARRNSANFLVASAAGSGTRVTGPLDEPSVRPSSAVRAVTRARFGLTPIG